MRTRMAGLALLALVTVLLAGCADTIKISQLLADPAHWRDKTVRVVGTVQNSMGLMGQGAYSVNDGTGNIWVISRSGVPARGAQIAVEGKVFQGAQIMGQSFGVAIRETKHRTR